MFSKDRTLGLCEVLEVNLKVKEVLQILDQTIPFSTAESWDNSGLALGDPEAEVVKIACSLDASPQTIRDAHAAGANLLVTHHPIFLESPNPITSAIQSSSFAGQCVWEAIQHNLSIISLHTNLDKSTLAHKYIAGLLEFNLVGRLEEPDGYGICMSTGGIKLNELAQRCSDIFDTNPLVWGMAESRQIDSLVYCSGSAGDLGSVAIRQGLDCLICGECGYHRLLELDEAGVAVIVLGHDASEKPFAHLLADILSNVVSDSCIEVLDEPRRWRALA